jgi:hypothetical protein
MALWTPAEITTALWLDASDASTLFDEVSGGSAVAADGAVARWEDKSGNDRHCTQSTPAARAVRKTAVQNSLDCLLFSGSNWYLGTSSPTTGDERTVLAVCRSSNATGGAVWSSRSSNRSFLCRTLNSNLVSGDNTSTNVTTTFNLTTPKQSFFLQCWQSPATRTIQYRANGDLKVTSGTILADSGNPGYTISRLSANTTENWPGEIAEIIVVDAFLDIGEVQKLEGYLAWKWGVAGNLPADHPFKNAPPYLPKYFWGTVSDKNGNPAGRTIYLVNESISELVGAYESDPVTGEYLIEEGGIGPFTLYFSGEPDRNAQVFSGVQPADLPE